MPSSRGRRGSGAGLLAAGVLLLLSSDAMAQKAPASSEGGATAKSTPASSEDEAPVAPRAVDVMLLGFGGSSEGLALRFGGGATPWAVGSVALGGRVMFGVDAGLGSFGPDTGRLSVAFYPRAAVGADVGWSRFELGLGLGAAWWRKETEYEDGRVDEKTRLSPAGELGGAWLFGGRKADIGLEVRGEAIGLDSFGLIFGIRAGGRLP